MVLDVNREMHQYALQQSPHTSMTVELARSALSVAMAAKCPAKIAVAAMAAVDYTAPFAEARIRFAVLERCHIRHKLRLSLPGLTSPSMLGETLHCIMTLQCADFVISQHVLSVQ